MKESHIRFNLVVTGIIILALSLNSSANWPQWRGPNSNGSTDTAHNLAVDWDQNRNVLWRATLPSWSAATPVVWEGIVFVTSAEAGFTSLVSGSRRGLGAISQDKIFLLALNRKDGSIRWKSQIDSGNQLYRKQNSASPSPITDGKHVWIMTGN